MNTVISMRCARRVNVYAGLLAITPSSMMAAPMTCDGLTDSLSRLAPISVPTSMEILRTGAISLCGTNGTASRNSM